MIDNANVSCVEMDELGHLDKQLISTRGPGDALGLTCPTALQTCLHLPPGGGPQQPFTLELEHFHLPRKATKTLSSWTRWWDVWPRPTCSPSLDRLQQIPEMATAGAMGWTEAQSLCATLLVD